MLKLYLNIYISHDIYGPDFEFDPPPPIKSADFWHAP